MDELAKEVLHMPRSSTGRRSAVSSYPFIKDSDPAFAGACIVGGDDGL